MDMQTIRSFLEEEKPIKLSLFNLSDSIQQFIYNAILEILTFYNKENLFLAVYTAIFEATMNAVKANSKKAFFRFHQLDAYNEIQYNRGTLEFKKIMNENGMNRYSEIAKEMGMYIRILIEHSVNGAKIEVINNCTLLKQEEMRIRRKFRLGQKYNSIVDFYADNADNTEGEGLGLVVSLLMLKQDGIPISDFRIGSRNGVTKARLEIPFTPNYISERKQYEIENHHSGF